MSKKPDLILTSDWHIRASKPICRTDDFISTQFRKMDFVSDLQQKYNCQIIHAGDLFHYWKPSPWLLSATMKHMPDEFYTVAGQHDLPQNNFKNYEKSGLATLEEANKINLMDGFHWGQIPKSKIVDEENRWVVGYGDNSVRDIITWHKLVWKNEKPYPDCREAPAKKLLRKYDSYDLLVTGDHHKPFTETYKDSLLVNPGPLTRQAADKKDLEPRVYLYYAEENKVEAKYIPIDKDAVTREHIDNEEEKNERIQSFVNGLTDKYDVDLSFKKNLEKFFEKNDDISKEVKEKVFESIMEKEEN